MAEVYAGFLSHTDHEIGRLLDSLEQAGELDNTIIVFCSDNGASGEGGPDGSVNENKFFNGIPDSLEENLKYLDDLGSPATYNHYPTGWAAAFNTPMKMWKRFNFEGGTADSLLVSWPAGIEAAGELRHQYCHATDIVPMIYDCLGVELPEVVKGYPQVPLEGVSMRPTFEDADAPTPKDTAFFSMLGSRAIWHKGWKAVAVHPSAPSNWSHFAEDRWELYNTEVDRTEAHDLAAEHPVKVKELVDLWYHEAGRYHGLPLDDRTALEILLEERPQLTVPRDRYVYRSGLTEVPEASAVNIRNRSFTIAAEVEIADENAGGVVFAHGSRFGGHALYLKNGTLKYVNNFCGITEQTVEASGRVPTGKVILSAAFEKEDDSAPTSGTLTLYVNDEKVGEGSIRTQPGKFALSGEGLNIGRDGADPVTQDYSGARPWAFSGGTIHEVVVDVSGDPFIDVEKEAAGAFMRD